MTIVKSQGIKGKLTHWLAPEHKDTALTGKFFVDYKEGQIKNKPEGLWLSWNDGWEKWCESESNFIKEKVCVNASLKKNLKIWHIDCLKDFEEIWNEFVKETNWEEKYPRLNAKMLMEGNKFWDWLKEKEIDGVALTDNGQWATRIT